MEDIYGLIFGDPGEGELRARAPGLTTLVGNSRDLFIETVNMIAAAAAIARTTEEYGNLLGLVLALVSEHKPWDDLGFRLAEACLQRHLGQTNYFLLQLLEAGVFRPYVLYKFIRNQGALCPLNTALLLYFARELKAFRPSWFDVEWQRAIADMRESPRGFLSIIDPVYRTPDPGDWTDRLAAKRTGLDSATLRIIADDDVAAFQRADLKPDATVPYSPFNDFFHFEYKFSVTDGHLNVVGPSLMDAVGLFGAQRIFEWILQNYDATADQLIGESIHSLVAGTNVPNEFARMAADRGVSLNDTLRDAIRWHNHGVFEYLIEKDVGFDPPALDAVFRYSNFRVFQDHTGLVATREKEEEADPALPAPTLFHFMARGNSVHAFKTALFANPNAIDPFAVASDTEKRTFLHWAANYGAREVTRQWARLWGNRGFDALDAHNWNPSHYAFMRGLSDEPPPDGKGYGKYACSKPFYHYMVKRSDLEYDPDTDPDVEEWPDAADPAAIHAGPPAPPPPPRDAARPQ